MREPWLWVVLGLVLLAIALAALTIAARRAGGLPELVTSARRRPHRNDFRPEGTDPQTPRKRAAVVVNPTKFADATALEAVRERIATVMLAEGFAEPWWLETTSEDPGTGQARTAVEHGAAVVCVLGGDGTVRAVAAGLAGSETPLGLLSGGTGNLLARNLDLPVDSVERALLVALTGQNQPIDVGRLVVDRSEDWTDTSEHLFLVMSGLGFDAQVMADTPERLKARVGPAAYAVTGARSLVGRTFRARLRLDADQPITRRARTVVVGNCGRLLGGLTLMPDAKVDDGLLDVVVISPRGPIGWTAVVGGVVTRNRRGHPFVDRHTAAEVEVRVERPQEVQVDGDHLGPALALRASVEPLALVVRVAHKS